MPPEIIRFGMMGLVFLVPIIAILTRHQQKMATILNRNQQLQPVQPDAQQEMATLRELVHQQTIAIDNLTRSQAQLQAALAEKRELSERIGA